MLVFNPDSEILLCSTPLESDNKNQLHFATEAAQEEYFLSTVVRTYDGTTYQRKDDVIRINANIEDLYNCNYVMYQNRNFTNKWFYAFITDMSFLNNSTTAITIETDVFQTWMFDVEIKPSFVSREHTNNDMVGANIVPEDLETGDYICTNYQETTFNDMDISVAVSDWADDTPLAGYLLDGTYTGLRILTTPANDSGVKTVNAIIDTYAKQAKLDAIVAVFMTPAFVVGEKTRNVTVSGVYGGLNGYIPRNNKLYTSQFYFLNVTNNSGTVKTFAFEYFNSPSAPTFHCQGVYNMMPSIWCTPLNYKGVQFNFDNAVTLLGFPQCAWSGDLYKNWYSQKYLSNAITIGVGVGATALGMSTANPVVASFGVMSALHGVSQIVEHQKVPNQAMATQSGDYDTIALNKSKISFQIMSIKSEMARVIDDYFTMFGYQTNRVKVPNIGTRQNWNYVETQHINIVGDIPNDHMDRLKEVYNSGVTIWNNPDTFGDYSQANGVV